jgi:NitT/TauT family transport system substrate-binding protein
MKAFKKTMMAALTAIAFTATANAASIQIRFADLGLNADNVYQYLAVEKGVYEKFGLDIRRTSFLRGGPGLVAAAASGQVDLGDVGVPLLTGLSRGFALRIVGAPAMKGEEFLVVARPNVKDINSLRDQLVGVSSIGGGQDQAIKKILKAHGLAPNSIKMIAYGNAAGGYVALQSGRLAAVVISEPDASRAEVAGVGKLLAKAADYYGRYEQSYIFASPVYHGASRRSSDLFQGESRGDRLRDVPS